MKKRLGHFVLAALLATLALPAAANVLVASPSANAGPLYGHSPQTIVVTSPFATGVSATLNFNLLGYGSLDGLNGYWTDTFTLTVNGTELFEGGFDMGGYGAAFGGPMAYVVSTEFFGSHFNGGLTRFSVPHTLIAGDNTYVFDYGRLDDEAYGLASVVITADVPEPLTLGLIGFGLLGMGWRRRKSST